ncbi:MAG: hypothetical protein ACYS0F_05260 [Planctomycetota bacterium]|jgi:hypothetical protein
MQYAFRDGGSDHPAQSRLAPLGPAFGGGLGSLIGMRTCLFIASAGVLAATAFIQFSSLRNRTT